MIKKTLKQYRLENKLTQKQVAMHINKTVTFISLLENGKRNASDATKESLAKLYKCEVSDIFLALKLTDS